MFPTTGLKLGDSWIGVAIIIAILAVIGIPILLKVLLEVIADRNET